MLVNAVTLACVFVVAVINTCVYELWEQNFEFPSLQAHLPQGPWQMCLLRDYRVTDSTTLQAHIFGVPRVCL